MDSQRGAPAIPRDGADLGNIDRVIVDPAAGESKNIVIRNDTIPDHDLASSLTSASK